MPAHSHSAHKHTCTHASIYLDAYVNMSMFAYSQVFKHICVHEAYTFMCKPMGCMHVVMSAHACVCTHSCLGL